MYDLYLRVVIHLYFINAMAALYMRTVRDMFLSH